MLGAGGPLKIAVTRLSSSLSELESFELLSFLAAEGFRDVLAFVTGGGALPFSSSLSELESLLELSFGFAGAVFFVAGILSVKQKYLIIWEKLIIFQKSERSFVRKTFFHMCQKGTRPIL